MLVLPLFLASSPVRGGGLVPEGLRCEYLRNPQGIDAPHPRLSWFSTSPERGERQTAYRILVAGSRQALDRNRGDLWDSGKVPSGKLLAEYAGKRLDSRTRCFWKVRVWNAKGQPGPWSPTANWSMGLLSRSDWKAEWIASPILADPANRPRTPIHCYRSELSAKPDAPKWVALDLGTARAFDRAELAPARPQGLTYDIGAVQFPRRFRLVASDAPDFGDAKVLVDQTASDFPEPRGNSCEFRFGATKARYLRLEVTRLGVWDAHDYGVFLARFSLFSGKENVSIGAHASASDSVENANWSTRFLVEPQDRVEFAPFPAALDPKVPDVFSPSRATSLRRDFVLEAPVRRATLYATARGFYEARINGRKVGSDFLTPGFTDYRKRITYQAYDVTDLLHQGPNTLAALLGYGWYAGHMNLAGNAYLYGYFPQLAAQLEVELTNGRRVTVVTDRDWRTTLDGAVRWSDLLDGEASDLRKEPPGWDRSAFDASAWQPAWAQALGSEALVAQRMPPVREIREIEPVSRKEVRPGVWVYDLGQEIAGWVRIRANGPAGTHIVVRHTEAVKPDGEIDPTSLWGTPQRDDYFLDGKGAHTLQPHFTYHGFRYFEISGLATPPEVVAVSLHNDVDEIGRFECSNPLFDRLMAASKWTQRNLLFDVPAGCAARSERLAWTGDIRPCVQTALFNFDAAAFFEKYAADLRDDQKPDGRFTDICPHAHLTGTDICVGSPGWADAGVSLPWDVYVDTGDVRLLSEHYEAAKRWVDFVHRQNPDLLWKNARGMDWGDWLSAGEATPKELGSTAFFAHSADLVGRMARVLGRGEDAASYEGLFRRIKAAFVARYVSPEGIVRLPTVQRNADVKASIEGQIRDGRLSFTVDNQAFGVDPAPNVPKSLLLKARIDGVEETHRYPEGERIVLGKDWQVEQALYGTIDREEKDVQGSYALALRFGLLEEPLRTKAVERLLTVIARDGGHPTTGFWSSVKLPLALSDLGSHEVASKLVDLTTAPSWGHMLEAGGTTFWEAYDADQKTLSLNHWTHSACGEWLWRDVAGLSPDPAHPGYQRFVIHPRPTPEVSWCKAEYRSIRGPIEIDWHAKEGRFALALQVPSGSIAKVFVPGSHAQVDDPTGVRRVGFEDGCAVFEVESGVYRFTAKTE